MISEPQGLKDLNSHTTVILSTTYITLQGIFLSKTQLTMQGTRNTNGLVLAPLARLQVLVGLPTTLSKVEKSSSSARGIEQFWLRTNQPASQLASKHCELGNLHRPTHHVLWKDGFNSRRKVTPQELRRINEEKTHWSKPSCTCSGAAMTYLYIGTHRSRTNKLYKTHARGKHPTQHPVISLGQRRRVSMKTKRRQYNTDAPKHPMHCGNLHACEASRRKRSPSKSLRSWPLGGLHVICHDSATATPHTQELSPADNPWGPPAHVA